MAFKHLAYIFLSVNSSSFYTSLVILGICYYLYRVKKHMDVFPAAPGNLILGNLLDYADRKNVLQNLLEHTLRTGKILRMTVGPAKPSLFVVDRKMMEFTVTANRYLTKAKFYVFFEKWLGDGLVTSGGGAKWKSRRRALTPSFSQSSILQNFISVFEDQGNLLIKVLETEVAKASVDLHPIIKRFTMDVICECALGISIHSQENKNSVYAENVEMLQDIAVRRTTSFFKRFDLFFRFTEEYKTEKRALRILDEFFDRILELKKRKSEGLCEEVKGNCIGITELHPVPEISDYRSTSCIPLPVIFRTSCFPENALQAQSKTKPQAEESPQAVLANHTKSKNTPQAEETSQAVLDSPANSKTKSQCGESPEALSATQKKSKTTLQAEESPQAILATETESKTKTQAKESLQAVLDTQAKSKTKFQAEDSLQAVLATQTRTVPQAKDTPQAILSTQTKSKSETQAEETPQAVLETPNSKNKFQAEETPQAVLATKMDSQTTPQVEDTSHLVLEDRLQSKTKPQAVLDILLSLEIDGKPMTRDDLREEINTIIFAGYDTTATAISYTLYAVARYPEIQDKIYEEQKQIFGEEIKKSKTTYEDIGKMDYLSLVIKESLRMYPPIPFIANRVSKDLKYADDIILPEGLNIGKFIYGIHHNPDYFHDPEEFIPERFKDKSLLPYTYMPFSLGPRQCIGKRFGLLEIKCTLSKIFRNYRVHPVPGHSLQLVPTMSLVSDTGIRVSLEKL